MKAIETHYKGCRFRSRLEARWAVFFDAMGVPWEYEPEGFVLPDGSCYLPDFYIHPEGIPGGLWIEVKGTMTPADENKIKQFRLENRISIFKEIPENNTEFLKKYTSIQQKDFHRVAIWQRRMIDKALFAARSARFEYGEKPAVDGITVEQQKNHRTVKQEILPKFISFAAQKKRIYASQNICGICGRPVDPTLKYPHPLARTIDHIIPIVRGGHPSDLSNLQLAHWICHKQKLASIIGGKEGNNVLP